MARMDEQEELIGYCVNCGAPIYADDDYAQDEASGEIGCAAPPPVFLPNFPVQPCYEGRVR
jgi:hypothetical protein